MTSDVWDPWGEQSSSPRSAGPIQQSVGRSGASTDFDPAMKWEDWASPTPTPVLAGAGPAPVLRSTLPSVDLDRAVRPIGLAVVVVVGAIAAVALAAWLLSMREGSSDGSSSTSDGVDGAGATSEPFYAAGDVIGAQGVAGQSAAIAVTITDISGAIVQTTVSIAPSPDDEIDAAEQALDALSDPAALARAVAAARLSPTGWFATQTPWAEYGGDQMAFPRPLERLPTAAPITPAGPPTYHAGVEASFRQFFVGPEGRVAVVTVAALPPGRAADIEFDRLRLDLERSVEYIATAFGELQPRQWVPVDSIVADVSGLEGEMWRHRLTVDPASTAPIARNQPTIHSASMRSGGLMATVLLLDDGRYPETGAAELARTMVHFMDGSSTQPTGR